MSELKRYRFSPNAPLVSSMDTYLNLLGHLYAPSNDGEVHSSVSTAIPVLKEENTTYLKAMLMVKLHHVASVPVPGTVVRMVHEESCSIRDIVAAMPDHAFWVDKSNPAQQTVSRSALVAQGDSNPGDSQEHQARRSRRRGPATGQQPSEPRSQTQQKRRYIPHDEWRGRQRDRPRYAGLSTSTTTSGQSARPREPWRSRDETPEPRKRSDSPILDEPSRNVTLAIASGSAGNQDNMVTSSGGEGESTLIIPARAFSPAPWYQPPMGPRSERRALHASAATSL